MLALFLHRNQNEKRYAYCRDQNMDIFLYGVNGRINSQSSSVLFNPCQVYIIIGKMGCLRGSYSAVFNLFIVPHLSKAYEPAK